MYKNKSLENKIKRYKNARKYLHAVSRKEKKADYMIIATELLPYYH